MSAAGLACTPSPTPEQVEAVQCDPDGTTANLETWERLYLRAQEHWRAERYEEAGEDFRRAAATNPYDADTFAGLGAVFLKTGDPASAVREFQMAVCLRPDRARFRAALGRAHHRNGQRALARREYETAKSLDPDNRLAAAGLEQLAPAGTNDGVAMCKRACHHTGMGCMERTHHQPGQPNLQCTQFLRACLDDCHAMGQPRP